MTSFQITLTPSKRAAGRFISRVRRALLKALAEEEKAKGLTQSEISRLLDVDRSVISRELHGQKDITLGRVAELAWALGRKPHFDLEIPVAECRLNVDLNPLNPFTSEWPGAIDEDKKPSTSALRIFEEAA